MIEMTSRAPLLPDDVDLPLDLVPPSSARRPRRHGGGRAVLVVDSIAIARTFLMQRLVQLGYRAIGAADGEAALAQVRGQAFAIVFCELVLEPGADLDGLGLCQAIRRQGRDVAARAVPAFVVVTGRLDASDRVRGALAGCDAYLTKPLSENALRVVLEAVDPAFN